MACPGAGQEGWGDSFTGIYSGCPYVATLESIVAVLTTKLTGKNEAQRNFCPREAPCYAFAWTSDRT